MFESYCSLNLHFLRLILLPGTHRWVARSLMQVCPGNLPQAGCCLISSGRNIPPRLCFGPCLCVRSIPRHNLLVCEVHPLHIICMRCVALFLLPLTPLLTIFSWVRSALRREEGRGGGCLTPKAPRAPQIPPTPGVGQIQPCAKETSPTSKQC